MRSIWVKMLSVQICTVRYLVDYLQSELTATWKRTTQIPAAIVHQEAPCKISKTFYEG